MHDNQMHEYIQAKHQHLMQNAANWRRTRLRSDDVPAKSVSIKHLSLVPVTVIKLLIRR